MARSTISKYMSGDRLMMESETALKLGKALGVRPEYLLLLDDEMTLAGGAKTVAAREPAGLYGEEERVVVPRLLRIAAGVPEYTPLDGKRNVITDRRSLQKLIGGAIPDGDPARVVFAADVHGDSMAPGITEGDTLIVQRYRLRVRRAAHRAREHDALPALRAAAGTWWGRADRDLVAHRGAPGLVR